MLTVEFNDNLGAPVDTQAFNTSFYTRVDIWLTLDQTADVQHPL